MSGSQDNLQESSDASSQAKERISLPRICDELEDRLRAGQEARCEELFAQLPWLIEDSDWALDLIYTEFNVRRELGQSPSPQEYFHRFPQWKTELSHQFQLDCLLVDSPDLFDASAEILTHSQPDCCAHPRFRAIEPLAKGAVGKVTRALDTQLDREVAIKSIQSYLIDDDCVRNRFLREAGITSRLEHPGVVPVYAKGTDANGNPFYAMRLIRGQNLQQAIEGFHALTSPSNRFHSIEFVNLIRRFLSVCETIAYAHSRGVIHRDIKPQNIMLGPYGETLVVDWGLAKTTRLFDEFAPTRGETDGSCRSAKDSSLASELADYADDHGLALRAGCNAAADNDPRYAREESTPSENSTSYSRNALIGTPAFMSPEQASGAAHQVGPTSDIYSLGATLHMLLTGKGRFGNSNIEETLMRVASGQFARPRNVLPSIPKALDAICMKALACEPSDRYASASELAADIEHWLADEPVSAARYSVLSRLGRIMRRHRVPVMAAVLALLMITTISILAAIRINTERLSADQQRQKAEQVSARLALDRGLQLVESHEAGAGMLWFDRALRLAPVQDVDLRRVILTNMSSARRDLLSRKTRFIREHTDIVSQFSTDGKWLLTCNKNGRMTLFDADSGETLRQFQLPGATVVGASLHSESAHFYLIEGSEFVMRRVDFASDAIAVGPPLTLNDAGKPSLVRSSPDQKWIAAVDARSKGENRILIWHSQTGEKQHQILVGSPIADLRFLSGSKLLSVGTNYQAKVWSLGDDAAPKVSWLINEHVYKVAVPLTGQRMFTINLEGSWSCWDHAQNRKLFSIPCQSRTISSFACSTDGRTVAVSSSTGILQAWSVDDRLPACELLRMNRFLNDLRFRPNSQELLVSEGRLNASLWALPDSNEFAPRLEHLLLKSVAFSFDGSLAVTSRATIARIRDGVTGKALNRSLKHKQQINQALFRPDGKVVLTISQDGTARLWDVQDGQPFGTEMEHRSAMGTLVSVECAAFSPNGDVIATGDIYGVIRIWNGQDECIILPTDGINGKIKSLAFSSKSTHLVAGYSGQENVLCAWDFNTGKLIWNSSHEEAHKESVRSVEYSPDGRYVVSASNDDTARFWNAADGSPVGQAMQHLGEVFAARFSPDGQWVVTAGYDSNVRLWRVPSGEPFGTLMQHDGLVVDAFFSPNGQRLLTAGADKTARLWDVKTCLPLSAPLYHPDVVMAVRYHPTQEIALTTNRLWRLPSPITDNPSLVTRMVRLSTERMLTDNNSIQRIDQQTLKNEADEFFQLTGQNWQDWY